MTALVETREGARPLAPHRAGIVRNALEAAERLADPWRMLTELNKRHGGWMSHAPGPLEKVTVNVEILRRPDGRGEELRQNVRRVLVGLPPMSALRDALSAIEAVSSAPVDGAKNRLLIGVMVDRYPNLKAHEPATYVEGLVFEARNYPPQVVAKATLTLAQTAKFLPSPAEFAEALAEATVLTSAGRILTRAIDAREAMEAAVAEAQRLGPSDMTQEWREALQRFANQGNWNAYQLGPAPGQQGCLVDEALLKVFGIEADEHSKTDNRVAAFSGR